MKHIIKDKSWMLRQGNRPHAPRRCGHSACLLTDTESEFLPGIYRKPTSNLGNLPGIADVKGKVYRLHHRTCDTNASQCQALRPRRRRANLSHKLSNIEDVRCDEAGHGTLTGCSKVHKESSQVYDVHFS
jgi:hypothetical protein